MKLFRFGVNAWSAGSRAEWTDKARRAEEFGYSVFTVPDHARRSTNGSSSVEGRETDSCGMSAA